MINRVLSCVQENPGILMAAKGRHGGKGLCGAGDTVAPQVKWLEVNYGNATFLISSYGACEQQLPQRRRV